MSVAEQLRQGRERQKLTVHQAAELTKIKTDHIRALEAGDYGAFSAPVYIRGFVRTYARYLKLDEAQLLAQLDGELGSDVTVRRDTESTQPSQPSVDFLALVLSRLNWRLSTGVLTAVVLLVIGVTTFRHWQSNRNSDPLKDLGPGMYEPKQGSSGELLPLSTK